MSYRLVSAAWSVPLPGTAKLVLIRLCDFADDSGVCWPGVDRLASDTGVCERAVRNAIRLIEKRGHLTKKRGGPRGTIYHIILALDAGIEPEKPAPDADIAPSEQAENRHNMPPIPALGSEIPAPDAEIPAPDATKLSLTKKEPTKEPVKARRGRSTEPIPPIPPWVPPPLWNDFVENREAIGHPLTAVAARRIFQELDDFRGRGISIEDTLNQSIMNGYRGVFEPRNGHNGRAHNQPKQNSAQRAFAEFSAELDRIELEKTNGH